MQQVHGGISSPLFVSISLLFSLSFMMTHEIRSQKNASLACVIQAECKVYTQKSRCREVNILLYFRNYHIMHMDLVEHSQSRILKAKMLTYLTAAVDSLLHVVVVKLSIASWSL